MTTTSCTKAIWRVVFHDNQTDTSLRTRMVAAHDIFEVLLFYTDEAIKKIVTIEKTGNEVTYHY